MMTIICQWYSSQWMCISLWYPHEIGILHFLWIQSLNSSSSSSELNNCIDSDGLDVYSIDVGLNSLCSHTEAACTVILWVFTTCGTLYVLAIPQTFAYERWLNLSSNLHEAAATAMVPWHSTHDNLVVCNIVSSSNLGHKHRHHTWLTLCNWPSVSRFLLCLYIWTE
jgi:hypothetical protein